GPRHLGVVLASWVESCVVLFFVRELRVVPLRHNFLGRETRAVIGVGLPVLFPRLDVPPFVVCVHAVVLVRLFTTSCEHRLVLADGSVRLFGRSVPEGTWSFQVLDLF